MKLKIAYSGENGYVEKELYLKDIIYVIFETTTGRKFTVQFGNKGKAIRIRDIETKTPVTIIPEETNTFLVI